MFGSGAPLLPDEPARSHRAAPRADRHPSGAGRAAAAHAHELRVVLDLGESVLCGHGARPVVEAAVLDALDAATDTAGEVVMVTAAADEERLLAVVAPERVGGPLVGQALKIAVHGREAHALEFAVKFLRRHGAIGRA